MGGVLLRGLGRLCEVPREALGLEGTPSPGSLLGGGGALDIASKSTMPAPPQ